MTISEKMEDIKNRHDLALAERNFTEPGTENYRILSNIARCILEEYKTIKRPKRERIRNGFRLYGGKYHHIILNECEKV